MISVCGIKRSRRGHDWRIWRVWEDFNLLKLQKIGRKACFVNLCIVIQEAKLSNACFGAADCVAFFFQFPTSFCRIKLLQFYVLAQLPFGTGICKNWALIVKENHIQNLFDRPCVFGKIRT